MNRTTIGKLGGLLLLGLLSAGCWLSGPAPTASPGAPTEASPLQTLRDFLSALHAGDYTAAAELYGGPYQTMIEHNPGINPANHPALLQAACQINGAVCLRPDTIVLDEQLGAGIGEWVFRVTFLTGEGARFSLGPCCGGIIAPGQSEFQFRVRQAGEGRYRVVTAPVYAP